MLTKGLDNIAGTSGNDTIIGSIDSAAGGNIELNTLAAIDVINGGAGTDTLKVAHASGAVTLGNLSNVEIVEIESADVAGVTVDSSSITDITNLNILKAAGVVAATAGASTDVSVAMKAAGAAVGVDGGNNVNVTLTDIAAAADVVTVGATTAAKGDVVVDVTGKAATANTTLSAVNVTGGKTISVTQKATSDASAAATNTTGITINQGAITASANADTTTVTIKQDAAVAVDPADFTTGGATATTSVKFGALKANDAISVGGLTFVASEDMTAAEVAAAFANLTTGAAALIPAGVDTQSGGKLAQGEYLGQITGWTSGAVNGDTVVFTSVAAETVVGAGVAVATFFAPGSTSVAPVSTFTDGKADNAGAAGGVLGVTAGAVTVNGGAALATVTVDGYAGAPGASGIVGAAAALDTLNLSNGGAFGVTSSASTLALNLEEVTGAVTFGTAPTTLNVQSIGDNTSGLVAAATTTLNVSGTGTLNATAANLTAAKTIKVTETAGLNLTGATLTALESVDTTGTTGTTTVAILGNQATYAGGAGVDNVTISNANVAADKAIDLGAGDDTLTLTGVVAVPTVELKGGEGTDTLAMTSANAVALSANGNFEAKVSGFEKLSLTDAAATAGTVDLANMDDISYVVSNNSVAVTSAAANTVYAGAVAGLTKGDTIAFTYNDKPYSVTLTVDGALANVQADIDTAVGGTPGAVVASFTGTGSADLTLTAAANPVTDTLAGGNYTDADAARGLSVADATDTTATGVPASTVYAGAVAGLTNGDTIAFTYNGTALTATLAGVVGATATAAEVQAAVNTALVAGGANNSDVVASFTNAGADLTLTAANGRTLTGGAYADLDGAVVTIAATDNAANAAVAALTLDNMANNGTLELVAAGAGVIVEMADATGASDVFNIVTKVSALDLNFGTVTVADVETINITATDTNTTVAGGGVNEATLALAANKATVVNLGSSNAALDLDIAASTKVASVNGASMTGALTLDLSAHNGVAVTVTAGSGADVLSASLGINAKADKLNGGTGNDILVAGSNSAELTGGAGADLFVLNSVGNKEANTYSIIKDFGADDLLDLGNVASFADLTAVMQPTSQFTNYVQAALEQAGVNDAVWFSFEGNSYVVVDAGADSANFDNGQDIIIQLAGVDLTNASFNATYSTIALA